MSDPNVMLPPALQRAMQLLAQPPRTPDISNGYLDLLATPGRDTAPVNAGAIQALWASRIGSMLYDNAQVVARRLLTAWHHPLEWLNIPSGGTALDVGCGPGSITASLAQAVGPDGLALGVDVSEPMLRRAVHAEVGPQVGFLRADAQRLPLRDDTVDAVVSVAVLQLIPDPAAALGEMVRVLRPGGRLAVMVPTVSRAPRRSRMLSNLGARMFGDDEIADLLEDRGLASVRARSFGTVQWVRGRRG